MTAWFQMFHMFQEHLLVEIPERIGAQEAEDMEATDDEHKESWGRGLFCCFGATVVDLLD